MPERLRAVADLEVKAAEQGGPFTILEGLASVFDVVDHHRHIVKRGAFTQTIAQRVKTGKVKLLDSHVPDSSHVLGTVTEAKETKEGLWFRAELSADQHAQAIAAKIHEGHLDRLSIGYSIPKDGAEYVEQDDGSVIRWLTKLILFEISVVPFPAQEDAKVLLVKSDDEPLTPERIAEFAAERTAQLETAEAEIAKLLGAPATRKIATVADAQSALAWLERDLDEFADDWAANRCAEEAATFAQEIYRTRVRVQELRYRHPANPERASAVEHLAWLRRQAEVARGIRRRTGRPSGILNMKHVGAK